MKQVIVTGATGFIGANLTRRLLHDGHEVHLLVRPAHNPWRIAAVREDVHLHEVDFGDLESLRRIVAGISADWVFHLAAYGAYSSQTDLAQMVETNILGMINLVTACLGPGFEAFVNTGSSSEYGFKDHAPSESEALEPNSHYAVTKASATMFCRHTAQSRKVHLPTLRLYSAYGPYEEPTRLMPTLIVRGLEGGLPPLADPEIARDYVHIDDIVDAYLLAAERPGPEPGAVYNVGTQVQTSIKEVVDIACRTLPIGVEPEWGSMANRQWDTSVWVSDNRKIRDELGWQPRHSFEAGLRLMVGWFQDNPEMLDFYRRRLG